jgi:hypothetical protein
MDRVPELLLLSLISSLFQATWRFIRIPTDLFLLNVLFFYNHIFLKYLFYSDYMFVTFFMVIFLLMINFLW